MRRIAAALILLVGLLPAGARAEDTDCDWKMYGHNLAHSFSTECSDVSLLNVATTHVKWVLPTPAPVTATPTVVDGVVYVGSADGTFYALDADPAPGPVAPKWTFE